MGDTRTYSDFIMYMVKTGRFQHNNLLDSGRRKGVLNLVQSERVVKLTLERRLSPINVAFTAGGKKQLVYLIALVRAGNVFNNVQQSTTACQVSMHNVIGHVYFQSSSLKNWTISSK